VLVAGPAAPADVVSRFTDSFGPLLHTLYGSTEAGYATVAGPGELREHPTTAGRPLPGVSVEVRDELGRRCADGVEGRIWVGSGAVFSGYIDGGDAVRSNGMIDTGDLGRIDGDGLLHIHGRSDDVIISGGENVHPAEIEEALRDLPEVADIAAVGGNDPVLGEHVVIHVVPAAGVGRDEVRSALTARAESGLAPYQRPARIEMHDELPHSDTGKVLRRLLR
jgi:acyl-CoA synthetase (AMP-forming)/AMP-acid ligase II